MKQPRQTRASQFSPFAALRGLEELIEEKHEVLDQRRELMEDTALLLSDTLRSLRKGDAVRVTYYNTDRYKTFFGKVEHIDEIYRNVKVGGNTVHFDDIFELEIINEP